MTNTISNINRPPIGFIVEGTGEYNAYPSLVSRILAVNNLHLPIVNSGGCGTIYRNLGRLLSNLILTYHPLNIIVTVDLIDAIKQKMHKNCEELRLALESNIGQWVQVSHNDSRLFPLPQRVIVVIQIQKFETWIISDVDSLVQSHYLNEMAEQLTNVDENISDPTDWLKKHKISPQNIKNPVYAKELVSQLNPLKMRNHSRSFDKFFREVTQSYESWCVSCGLS